MWVASLLLLLMHAPGGESLEKGVRALKEFRTEAALRYLEQAKLEGPHSYEDNVRLHEQLGIAYAYLGRTEEALGEFALVLALSPGHAISYTLSPKVTFLFEKARQEASSDLATNLDLAWPRELEADSAVPLEIEVVADPKKLLQDARVNFRLKGASSFESVGVSLPEVGGHVRTELPPIGGESEDAALVELYLSAYDGQGNEVYRWGSQTHPREIALRPPERWYEKWWVWTLVGGAAAAGATTLVFFMTREPSPTVGASFEVLP